MTTIIEDSEIVITKTLINFLIQRQRELCRSEDDALVFHGMCYGYVVNELEQLIGQILTTRSQGVDCLYCENSEKHIHVTMEI